MDAFNEVMGEARGSTPFFVDMPIHEPLKESEIKQVTELHRPNLQLMMKVSKVGFENALVVVQGNGTLFPASFPAGHKGICRPSAERRKFHIPSDLVVGSWASSVESRSTLDFLYVPDASLRDLS